MFLITTADTRTWKNDEKVLFLGEWCRRYSLRARWQAMEHEVLPYHWDDRARLERDYHYLTGVIERTLAALSERLNAIHGTDHPLRYWRIVIGPWLAFFIESLFDRYLSVRAAIDAGADRTWCLQSKPDTWLPQDFQHFVSNWTSDGWSHQIYSELMGALGTIRCEVIGAGTPAPARGQERMVKRMISAVLSFYSRLLPARLNRVVMVGSYFPLWEQMSLQLRMGQLPYLSPFDVAIPMLFPNWEIREGMNGLPAGDEFESILGSLIYRHIPLAYVEGYRQVLGCARGAYPASARAIYAASNWISNDAFKFWAAEQANQGALLFCAQHGGHYGMGGFARYEEHQLSICERLFTWGWQLEEERTSYLPSGKLVSARQRIRAKPEGGVLWVLGAIPRYAYHLYSAPIAGQFECYLQDQFRFARELEAETRAKLVIRLYPQDYGWDIQERFRDAGYGPHIDHSGISFSRLLRENRICVSTTNTTTFIETLVANFPTLIFWDPKYWELRDSAAPFFDALQAVGIFHTTPESAARFLNRILDSLEEWWWSPDVQQARRYFVQEFARLDPGWKEQWLSGMKFLMDEQGHDG